MRHPAGDERHVGQHRDHADAAEARVAEVHVAVLAAGDAAGAAHVVGEVAVRGHAPDEVGAEVAVQDAHPVLGPERERRTDRDRLLPAAVVERPGHLALPIEREAPLLGGPHHRHEPEQRRAVRTGEQLAQGFAYVGLRVVTRSLVRDSDVASHFSPPFVSGRPLGSPPGLPLVAASGSLPRRLLDDGLRRFRPGALCLDRLRADGSSQIATTLYARLRTIQPSPSSSVRGRARARSARRLTPRRMLEVTSTWPRVPITRPR